MKKASGGEIIACSDTEAAVARPDDLPRLPVSRDDAFTFRSPVAEDGPRITALIAECPPLDRNSAYCNLLQCSHFADSCVVAERDSVIAGWISAYRPPSEPDSLFVWQVAVHEHARGKGLAGCLIEALLQRPSAFGAKRLTTTITEENRASWALFQGFARAHGLTLAKAPRFERDAHFAGAHDTEWQATIGPLPPLWRHDSQQSAEVSTR